MFTKCHEKYRHSSMKTESAIFVRLCFMFNMDPDFLKRSKAVFWCGSSVLHNVAILSVCFCNMVNRAVAHSVCFVLLRAAE